MTGLLSSVLVKLGISAVLGMIIGLEREIRKKPLGLKTSLVISVSSCLLTIVSIESANRFANAGVHVMDPMRLAAQIVSGIGFLGAGVILRKNNDVILGLTTAAMIWAASGLGIAVGAGFFYEAAIGLVLIILSVEIMPTLFRWIGPDVLKGREIRLRINLRRDTDPSLFIDQLRALNLKIQHVHVRDLDEHTLQLNLVVVMNKKLYATDVYSDVKRLEQVISVEAESL